jgi:filamentous hemagglutinin family protein
MSRRQSTRRNVARTAGAPEKNPAMAHPGRRLSRGTLLAGTSLLALVLAMPVAHARPIGSAGVMSAPNVATDAATAAAQQAAAAASQSSIALTRATQAIQAMQAVQAAARSAAQARQASITAPVNVPNGLAAGGLDPNMAAGWTGANAPTQTASDGQTTVGIQQTAAQAILNWTTFNIGAQTTLTFNQQGNASWVALNRVVGSTAPSQILGNINATGQVYVINQNGIIFGGNSQINVGSLIASTAGITDQQFLTNGIYSTQTGSTYNPSFTGAGGKIIVEQGALITTSAPTSVTSGGGFVLLMGTEVDNAGSITTPMGQSQLAAGDDFILRQGFGTTANQTSTTRGNEIAPVLHAGSSSGTVDNTGLVFSQQGDITLAGHAIIQDGILVSTTSVNQRGTIHLLNSASDATGSVTLTGNSTTLIMPELDSATTALDSQRDALIADSATQDTARSTLTLGQFNNLSTLADREDQSRVEIVTGGVVNFQNGSLTMAQGGQVAVSAGQQVFAATGSTIDVSGTSAAPLPMSSNEIQVNVQGNELRDSPANRDSGTLLNSNVWIDVRDLVLVSAGTGGYATDRYYTPGGLLEVSGYLNNTGHTIGEWTALGGTITLSAPQVVAQQGSTFNISGGSVSYASGNILSTNLLGSDGHIYSVDNAPADITFVGLAGGFVRTHNVSGQVDAALTEIWAGPFGKGSTSSVYEEGYTVGRDAGSLILSTPTSVFEGDIIANVITGSRQTSARPAGVTDGYTLTQNTAPLAGTLALGQYNATGLSNAYATNVVFGDNGTSVAETLAAGTAAPASVVNTAYFNAPQINSFGLGGVNVASKASVAIEAPLALANGGSLSITAPIIDINADVTARGGSIALGNIIHFSSATVATALTSAGVAQVNIGPDVTLDTHGVWTNALIDPSDLSGLAYLGGGNVTIDTTQGVTLASGSVIDVSSGAAILPTGKSSGGKGGNVSLIANDPFAGSGGTNALVLDGTIRAAGVVGGGTLTLLTSSVLIGDNVTATAPGQLVLPTSFFAQGFSNYNITGYTSVGVAAATATQPQDVNVVVPVYQITSQSYNAPTGSDPAAALQVWLPPLYQTNPLTATLVQRAGGSLTLNSAINAGFSTATGGTLAVGTGAQLTVDPGQSIRLEAYGQITVDGTLTAHSGSIAIINDHSAEIPSTVNNTGSFETGALSIWIGDNARLDVSGQAYTALDFIGRAYGLAPNGGSIVLGNSTNATTLDSNGVVLSTDAFIIVRPGAVLDASGASAAIDLAAGTSPTAVSQPVTIAGNGGSIALSSYDGIYVDGTLNARAGGAGASGGTLSVILETPAYPLFAGSILMTVSDDLRVPRTITITQSPGGSQLPLNLQPGAPDASLTVGSAIFSADGIAAGGFDNVSLFARSAIVFGGSVNFSAAQSIAFYQGALSDTNPNANVTITAPYVLLSGGTSADESFVSFYPSLGAASPGTGKLIITADLIDIQNTVSFGAGGSISLLSGATVNYDDAGFAEEDFISHGDIRFLAPTTTSVTGAMTTLTSGGNLVFEAEQLYPTTGATVQVIAGDLVTPVQGKLMSSTGSITISSIDGVIPDMPFSAFGNLSLYAATINQGGVLRAPLGSLQFGGSIPHTGSSDVTQAVNFLPGSITSVSGNGLVMPYGGTPDGTTYSYNGATVTAPTGNATGITISAIAIAEKPGATIDLSGGGTLTGAGFVSGSGGSVNVLTTPLINADPANTYSAAGNKVYAIVPSYGGSYAPKSPENGAGDPVIGQQITIPAGVPGLPAGTYTLLPSNNALLPGAFRVEIGAATTVATGTGMLPNGTYLTTGLLSIANTMARNALPSQVLLTPAASVRTYSSFNETGYSDFAIAQAATLNQLRPFLPMDAKSLQLVFSPGSNATNPALAVDGSVLFQPAAGGYGGQASITLSGANNIEIVASRSAATAGFAGVSLTASDLDALGASRLVIGGLPVGGYGAPAVNFGFNAVNSVIVRSGATLSAAEVFLLANGQITVESGAAINTIGAGAAPFDSTSGYVYQPGGISMLAVSNGYLNIGGNIQGTAAITIGAGARLYSEGTIGFSTTGAVTIDPAAHLGAAYLNLSVSSINLGDPSVMAGATVPSGLLLSQAFLDQLLQGDASSGAPPLKALILGASQSLNIFGSVDLSVVDPATGKADLSLILNTPAIYGYGSGSDNATLTMGSLYWNGVSEQNTLSNGASGNISVPPPAVAINGPGTGSGTLTLVADQIVFGNAPNVVPNSSAASSLARQIYGFSTVNLEANQISANGNQSLSFYHTPGATYGTPGTGGNLYLTTPLLTTAAGAVFGITTGGALTVVAPTGATAANTAAVTALGGEIDLSAALVTISTAVALPSGKFTVNAVGNIQLGAGANLDLSGRGVTMFDQTEYSWGGDVTLASLSGSINAAGSVINVSAVNNNAGTITATAVGTGTGAGQVALNGSLQGASTSAPGTSFNGGSITIDAQTLTSGTATGLSSDFAALNTALNASGFSYSRSFDLKQGGLVIGNELQARNITVSVDDTTVGSTTYNGTVVTNGSIVVTGTINASGTTPGTIRLAAKNDLTLSSTGYLDAHGTVLQVDSYGAPIDADNKATIELTSSSGTLTLAPNSSMDVSVTSPLGVLLASQGEIDLNASRTGETSGDININASSPLTIKGAKSVAVNAFWTYSPTDANGTIVQDNGDTNPVATTGADTGFVGLNQIDTRSQQFIAAAYNNNVAAGVLSTGLQNKLAGLTAYGSVFHLRPGVEIDSSAATGNNLTVSGDINLAGYRYGPGVNPNVYGSGEPGTLVLRASGNLNVLGSITDGFGPAPATPDDNGWTIASGATLTSSATTSQALSIGAGTTIPVISGTRLTYDVVIAAQDANGNPQAIAANVPISIAVTTAADFVLPTSWTTTADILPPSGLVIPKGTILPAGFTIPSGSVLNAGTMLPQQVAIAAMTVPAGTPLNMFAHPLTLMTSANLKAGDTIPSGSTVMLGGLTSGPVNQAITLTAPAALAAGSVLALQDDFGNNISFSVPVTVTNAAGLAAGRQLQI